ncbi:signal peptidase II [Candidatus Gracilibacteria bacterium]|nr:signal peptidase II [Candidatus Gracilibacteria bacterium]
MSNKNTLIFILTLTATLIADLLSKHWAFYELQERVWIIPEFVYMELVYNIGIAFSLPITGIVLKVGTIVLIFALFGYYFYGETHKKSMIPHIAFAMILGGALGNGIERILIGKVTDFIGVPGFAVMNMADIGITLGALLYIFYELSYKHTS